MNGIKQIKQLMESVTILSEGRYWDNKGAYENEAKELQRLVPGSGPAETHKGEIMRAATKIYYDYYNNGFGNDWAPAAQFLMNNVKLPSDVISMMLEHGAGHIGHGLDNLLERMMSTVIEEIYTEPDRPNITDMWDTDVTANFTPEDDGWYEEDDWDNAEDYDDDEDEM